MNVMSVLKAEISRLAKKEAKREVAPVKKVNATYRGLIAGLRKRIEFLEKGMAGLKRMAPKAEKVLASKAEPQGRFWITGKGVRKLRKRLGLTQAVFGKLVGVTPNAVVLWERKDGKIGLRKATAGRLQEIRGKGKREVAAMLGAGKKAEPKAKAKAKPKKAPKGWKGSKKAAVEAKGKKG